MMKKFFRRIAYYITIGAITFALAILFYALFFLVVGKNQHGGCWWVAIGAIYIFKPAIRSWFKLDEEIKTEQEAKEGDE
jgi:hypothetical protein